MPINVQHGIPAIGALARLALAAGNRESDLRTRQSQSQKAASKEALASRERIAGMEGQQELQMDQINFEQDLAENEQIQEHKLEAMRLQQELAQLELQAKSAQKRRDATRDAKELLTNFDPEMIFDNPEDAQYVDRTISAAKNRRIDWVTAANGVRERLGYVSAGKIPEYRKLAMEQEQEQARMQAAQEQAQQEKILRQEQEQKQQRIQQAQSMASDASKAISTVAERLEMSSDGPEPKQQALKRSLYYNIGQKIGAEAIASGRELSDREIQQRLLRHLESLGVTLSREEMINRGEMILENVRDGIEQSQLLSGADDAGI